MCLPINFIMPPLCQKRCLCACMRCLVITVLLLFVQCSECVLASTRTAIPKLARSHTHARTLSTHTHTPAHPSPHAPSHSHSPPLRRSPDRPQTQRHLPAGGRSTRALGPPTDHRLPHPQVRVCGRGGPKLARVPEHNPIPQHHRIPVLRTVPAQNRDPASRCWPGCGWAVIRHCAGLIEM